MAQKVTSTITCLWPAALRVRAAEVQGCCCAPFAAEEPPPAEQPASGRPAANSCGGFKANASQSSCFVVITRPLSTGGGGESKKQTAMW